ncbi:PH domain-containing protein [Streptomyces sp. MST-110588]|uniref:PH domain-containing protein n=1 Tax=Streptomyces sp. MST-110588 TaxID=2833628 RepID=UPI001F5C23F3|nr:PH domain-containing protein [Streptomyces sp. MST-110588]UNO38794.1 PH domain-containing protein [Streptomyces sp. MST-110588]
MQTIEFRAASRVWQWCAAAVFLVGGVIPACVITFGIGWEEFGRRVFAEPRGSDLREAAIGLLVCVSLSLVGYHYTSGRTCVDAEGIRTRTLLRRRFVPWQEIEGISVDKGRESYAGRRGTPAYRIRLDLANGRSLCLPAPAHAEFDSALEAVKGEIIRRRNMATAQDPSSASRASRS